MKNPSASNSPRLAGNRLAVLLTAVLLTACSSSTPSAPPPPVAPATPAAPSSPTVPVAAAPQTAAPRAEYPFQEFPDWPEGEWRALFDGQSLTGWRSTEFAGSGEILVEKGQMILRMGAMLSGVNLVRTNDLPTMDYELGLEAMKLEGSDFFCALTFPVGGSCCTFLLGGWGGGVVGISSLDGNDASLNETTKYLNFETNRWYRVRVRVTAKKLEAWIGSQKMVDVELEGRRVTVRPGEIEMSQPFGIATWQTSGAIRDVRVRRL
jgi:hypothetical protein